MADIGLVGVCVCGGGGDTSRGKALQGESYGELANKLASSGEGEWRR